MALALLVAAPTTAYTQRRRIPKRAGHIQMFTGIITDLGRVRDVRADGDTRIEITTRFEDAAIPIGASIACSGVCLTVIDKGPGWFAVQASGETLSCTTVCDWRPGTPVNLERALRLGDELGGHLVSGHVDGVGHVAAITPEAASRRFVFEAPAQLARFIASKGSVAIDGISLTVNEVDGARFGVNIIPHTLSITTLGEAEAGDRVNLEIDLLARYVARLLEHG
jgi:riboflavin synthase